MDNNKLHILWTDDNPLTAEHMVLMYGPVTKQHGFWEEVTIIIWGATSKLVAENTHVQNLIKDAQAKGVKFSACQACAEKLGTMQRLLDLDIEVLHWGKPLTELIKNKENLLTV